MAGLFPLPHTFPNPNTTAAKQQTANEYRNPENVTKCYEMLHISDFCAPPMSLQMEQNGTKWNTFKKVTEVFQTNRRSTNYANTPCFMAIFAKPIDSNLSGFIFLSYKVFHLHLAHALPPAFSLLIGFFILLLDDLRHTITAAGSGTIIHSRKSTFNGQSVRCIVTCHWCGCPG